MKSTIKKIKDIDFKQKIIINSLHADPKMVDSHLKRLQELFKDAPKEQINQRLNAIVVRDNIFDHAMALIAPCFDINIDEDDVKPLEAEIKKGLPNQTDEFIKSIAHRMISKWLIFSELAKLWDIKVTDEEVNEALEKYYAFSNQSIKQYLEDKTKFNSIRSVILEEKIVNKVIDSFPREINLKPVDNNQKEEKK